MYDLRAGHNAVEVDNEIIIGNPYLVHFGKYKRPRNITGFKTSLVSFKNEGDGLDCDGNTIIPTSSLPKFIQNIELAKKEVDDCIRSKKLARRFKIKEMYLNELDNLITLCKEAIEEEMYVIHFGI